MSLCPGSGLELREGSVWTPSYIGLCPSPSHSSSFLPCLPASSITVVRLAQNLPWLPSVLRIKITDLIRALYDMTLAH